MMLDIKGVSCYGDNKDNTMDQYRIEKDYLGDVRVPAEALYGCQTQRAVENFPVSGIRFPRVFIRALGLIKAAAAGLNMELGLLDKERGHAIQQAAQEVSEGRWDDQFLLDVFQTGSATSTNMNANEVIANRAGQILGRSLGSYYVHPNDHVNMSQSTNDVIPSVLHLSAYLLVKEALIPSLEQLENVLQARAKELDSIVKTGRTHLMDAMPIRMGQEIGGWAHQIRQGIERIESCLHRLSQIAMGGTAVGTGVNAPKDFGRLMAERLSRMSGLPLSEAQNHFAAQSSMDPAAELSGQLKTAATALIKIANDLRWMNSGPISGLGEISLPALQPGSSIMPGKVNPVICEAVMMACCQVIGNDVTITIANQSGSFELNTMLPLITYNLLQSITLLANVSRLLSDKVVSGFVVNRERIAALLEQNPILVTALNPVIGYDKAAEIAKKAYRERRSIKDVAAEMTSLSREELDRLLDPRKMTEGGIA